ncbi:extracellular solute-binding protein [Paenibacillus agricola]|uniref:Extracellular solute-binding protein n=1 Tax=Paenibacillus agricola TaxID=2716264 RepID=A0ABX0JD66_9BACL|nr:extracellular solute-binding protein [Paenibacillus agricola]NHN32683.1 extracellular solute-binding protein [Paenibacillus agricola]
MKKKTMLTALFLPVLLCLSTACSSENESADSPKAPPTPTLDKGEKVKEDPLKLSIMIEPRPDTDLTGIVPIIEKYTNTKLDFRITANLNDVLPVAMASGDLPDVLTFGNAAMRAPYMINAMRGGVIWDITTFIADYPNLKAIHPKIYENISLDGKIYGLPRVRPISRVTFAYRQDWLEKLGLPEPKTIDDYYNMLRAFTFNDPDGNGKHDTIGLTELGTANVERIMSILFGAPNRWGVKPDGSFVGTWETEEYLNSLKFMRKLYAEKLINQDFPVLKDQQWKDLMLNGVAGVYPRHIDEAYYFQQKMPDAKIGVISQLKGPNGVRTTGENGANGIIAFTKSGFKTEKDVRKALKFFDDLASKEMSNLFAWGVEGRHYKIENGKAVMTDLGKYGSELEHLRNQLLAVHANVNAIPGKLIELVEKGEALKEDNIQYAVFDPTLALISATQAEIGTQLNTIIDDALVKFIIGQIDEAGWKAEVEKWRKAGGSKVAKEYADEQAKLKKK